MENVPLLCIASWLGTTPWNPRIVGTFRYDAPVNRYSSRINDAIIIAIFNMRVETSLNLLERHIHILAHEANEIVWFVGPSLSRREREVLGCA